MTEDKREAGRQGGIARDKALTEERKKEIAQKGALARWGAKATHKGNFKDEFGFDVECYVLDDAQKTAVISQSGMGNTLGLISTSADRLHRLLAGRNIAPHVSRELREKVLKPLVFQGLTPVANVPPPIIHGYDVTILIDVCKAVIQAESEGKLLKRQLNVAKQAHIILNASAKAGIKGLVYALAGYDQTRQEVIEAFKRFVQQEARDYEREFPPQLYGEWYRLYQLPKPVRGRPWKAKHLTVDHVYHPLARSNGKILKLTRERRANSERGGNKLHQFLSEVGVKALRTHLGQVLGIARISKNQQEYEQHIKTLFGVQQEIQFDTPDE